MTTPTVAELMRDTERAFCTVFGEPLTVTSRETFGESNYRGGFRIVLAGQRHSLDVTYSDLQFEVSLAGTELFGSTVHTGFEGNTFSRGHFREYLPRIAASVAAAADSALAPGDHW